MKGAQLFDGQNHHYFSSILQKWAKRAMVIILVPIIRHNKNPHSSLSSLFFTKAEKYVKVRILFLYIISLFELKSSLITFWWEDRNSILPWSQVLLCIHISMNIWFDYLWDAKMHLACDVMGYIPRTHQNFSPL